MNRPRTPRLGLVALASVAVVVAACGSSDETGPTAAPAAATEPPSTVASSDGATITVYSGRGEDLVGPLLAQFEESTGIDVDVRYGDSAEMLLLIQEEGDNSPADVFYSQGAGFLGTLSGAGGLADLPSAVLDRAPAGLRSPAADWVGLSGRARVLVYNTEALNEAGLPASILDLKEPEWAGRIGWAPTNASLQDFVTALRAVVGEDEARSWLEGMVANATAYEGNTAILEAVASGEVDVGLANHYYLYRYLAEDPAFPVANHFFDDGDPGSLVNIAGAGVLSTTDEPAAAVALIEFLLSAEAQSYFAEQTYEIPVVPGIDTAADLPKIDSLSLPDLDLNLLSDLRGTIDLLTEVGAL
jgi:iron(III) transport system substrate-binding protein